MALQLEQCALEDYSIEFEVALNVYAWNKTPYHLHIIMQHPGGQTIRYLRPWTREKMLMTPGPLRVGSALLEPGNRKLATGNEGIILGPRTSDFSYYVSFVRPRQTKLLLVSNSHGPGFRLDIEDARRNFSLQIQPNCVKEYKLSKPDIRIDGTSIVVDTLYDAKVIDDKLRIVGERPIQSDILKYLPYNTMLEVPNTETREHLLPPQNWLAHVMEPPARSQQEAGSLADEESSSVTDSPQQRMTLIAPRKLGTEEPEIKLGRLLGTTY